LLADPEQVFFLLLREGPIGSDARVHEDPPIGRERGHERFQELEWPAGQRLARPRPRHLRRDPPAPERRDAAVEMPRLAPVAIAAEVREAHVLVVALEEDRRDVGALAERDELVEYVLRVRAAIDVVADEGDRVA